MITRTEDRLSGVDIPRVPNPFIVSSLPVKRVDELTADEQHENYAALAPHEIVLPVFHLSDRLILSYTTSIRITGLPVTKTIRTFVCTADALVSLINEDTRVRATIDHGRLVIEALSLNPVQQSMYIQIEYAEDAEHVSATDPRAPIFRYYAPDPRGISRRDDIAPPPARAGHEISPVSAGVARYEERTSASINRGVGRISYDMDTLNDALETLVVQRVHVPYRLNGSVVWENSDFGRLYPLTRVHVTNKDGLPAVRSFPSGVRSVTGSVEQVTGQITHVSFKKDDYIPQRHPGIIVDERTIDFATVPARRHAWAPVGLLVRGVFSVYVLVTEWIGPRRARIIPYVRYLMHMPDLPAVPLRSDIMTSGSSFEAILFASPYLDEQDNLELDMPADAILDEGDIYLTFQRVVDLKGSGDKMDDAYRPLEPLHQAAIRARSPFDTQLNQIPIVSQHAIRNAGLGGVRVGELGAGNTELDNLGQLKYAEDRYPAAPNRLLSNGPVYIDAGIAARTRRGVGPAGQFSASFIARDSLIVTVMHEFTGDDLGRNIRVLYVQAQVCVYATITRVLSATHAEIHIPLAHVLDLPPTSTNVVFEFTSAYEHTSRALMLSSATDNDALHVNIGDGTVRLSLGKTPLFVYEGPAQFNSAQGNISISALANIAHTGPLVPTRYMLVVQCSGWLPAYTVLSDNLSADGDNLVIPHPYADPPGEVRVGFHAVRERLEDTDFYAPRIESCDVYCNNSLSSFANALSVRVGDLSSSARTCATTQTSVAVPFTGVASKGAANGKCFSGVLDTFVGPFALSGVSAPHLTVPQLKLQAGAVAMATQAEVSVAGQGGNRGNAGILVNNDGARVLVTGGSNYAAATSEGVLLAQNGDRAKITGTNMSSLEDDVNYLNDQVVKLRAQNEALHNSVVLLSEIARNLVRDLGRGAHQVYAWAWEAGTTLADPTPSTVPKTTDNANIGYAHIVAGVQRALESSRNCAGYTYAARTGNTVELEGDRRSSVEHGVIGVGLLAEHPLGYSLNNNVAQKDLTVFTPGTDKRTFHAINNFAGDVLTPILSETTSLASTYTLEKTQSEQGYVYHPGPKPSFFPLAVQPLGATLGFRVAVIPSREVYPSGNRVSDETACEITNGLRTEETNTAVFNLQALDVAQQADNVISVSHPVSS